MSDAQPVEPSAEPPMVPPHFVVPQFLETPYFQLRPLTPAVVDKDYEALMSSADLLHAMFGRDWPSADFSREENLRDLMEHEQEFESRVAFAYTVLTPDQTRCLGCVYINPPRGFTVDARVYMWVRQSAYEQGLDQVLFQTVKAWIDEAWPFTNVSYPGRNTTGAWTPLGGNLM